MIHWRRGDWVAYVLGAAQMGDHGMTHMLDTMLPTTEPDREMPDHEMPDREITADSPLSSATLRYSLRPSPTADAIGPHETRPFGLRFARTFAIPSQRPAVRYCHRLQVAVDDDNRPMVEQLGWEEDQKKEWATKAESDGDEGKEEDTWGWEET